MNKLATPLLAIALLASMCSAGAQNYEDVCGISSFDDESNATAFIVIAFMFVTLSIAIAYMYSKFRADPEAAMWAKVEAGNLVISIILFIGLLVFFQASCEIAREYSGGNPFYAADQYLNRLINANGLTILRGLTYASLTNQFDATEYWYIGITPFTGSGVGEYANLRAFSSHKEFVIDLYLPIVASLTAQKQILEVIQWIGASVLLPFAFVMRLIPPTREFGNALIALFFSLYIVVPTLYAMSGEAFEKVVENPVCVDCGVHNFYSFGIDGGEGKNGGAASGLTWQKATFYKIGSTIPQAIFLPNIVLIVAITCVMALSKALRAMGI